MRIALDLSSMPVARVGAGHYMHNLVHALADVDASTEYSLVARDSILSSLVFPRPNFRTHCLAPESRPLRLVWEQTCLPFRLGGGGIDLLHSMHYTIPVLARTKRVVTFPDMTFFLFPGVHTPTKRLFFTTMMRVSAALADAIIAISESTRQDILRVLAVDPKKVFTVPLGVSPRFHPIADTAKLDTIRATYALPDKFVLYVGVLEPRKNLTVLVRAFRSLVDRGLPHALVLAGRKGWMCDEIYRSINGLGLTDRVVFTGYVPDEHLPMLYNTADIVAYPSIYEGFGLPVLEAMACGTPVVTSNASSMPEVAGEAAILVNPHDVNELAEQLFRLATNRSLRDELSQKGLERAKQFTWERTARETLAVYQRVAS